MRGRCIDLAAWRALRIWIVAGVVGVLMALAAVPAQGTSNLQTWPDPQEGFVLIPDLIAAGAALDNPRDASRPELALFAQWSGSGLLDNNDDVIFFLDTDNNPNTGANAFVDCGSELCVQPAGAEWAVITGVGRSGINRASGGSYVFVRGLTADEQEVRRESLRAYVPLGEIGVSPGQRIRITVVSTDRSGVNEADFVPDAGGFVYTLGTGFFPPAILRSSATSDRTSVSFTGAIRIFEDQDLQDGVNSFHYDYGVGGPIDRSTSEVAVDDNTPGEVAANETIGELPPGTEITYRLVAKNAIGSTVGPTQTVRTVADPPRANVAETGNATRRLRQLVLSGRVTTRPGSPAQYYFDWGPRGGDLRNQTPARPLDGGLDRAPVTETLKGLKPERGYDYRLVIIQDGEVTVGNRVSVFTLRPKEFRFSGIARRECIGARCVFIQLRLNALRIFDPNSKKTTLSPKTRVRVRCARGCRLNTTLTKLQRKRLAGRTARRPTYGFSPRVPIGKGRKAGVGWIRSKKSKGGAVSLNLAQLFSNGRGDRAVLRRGKGKRGAEIWLTMSAPGVAPVIWRLRFRPTLIQSRCEVRRGKPIRCRNI